MTEAPGGADPAPRTPASPLPRCSRRRLLTTAGITASIVAGSSTPPAIARPPTPNRLPRPSAASFRRQATPALPVPGFEDPTRWAGRNLIVGAWGGEVQDALRAAVWEPFAAATGCAFVEVATDYSRLSLALTDGQPYADLLLVDPIWAESALASGLIQPAPPAAVDTAQAATFPGGEGTVPAFAYALVAAYRRDGIGSEGAPAGWADWWDTQRHPGARALSRDPLGTFEFALLSDGVATDALYPLDLDRAIERLRAISGSIVGRWWDTGSQPVYWLGSGRADLASAWHHRVVAGQWDGLAVDLVWSQGLLVVDRWAIPSGAQAPDVAADLLRYAQTAEVQAALARLAPLGPTNPAALTLVDPLVTASLPTAPQAYPSLLPLDAGWWSTYRGEAVERMNSWLLGATGA